MTLLCASIAFDWFDSGGLSRYHFRDLGVASEFIRGDSIAEVSVREYRCGKFVALKIGAGKIGAGARTAGCRDARAACLRATKQFDHGLLRPGSMSWRCCGLATSRKNHNPFHVLAQELGKLPVRNPLG